VAFVVDRYGEYVLLRPTLGGANLLLWLAGPAMLMLAGGIAIGYLRARARATPPATLSPEEEARLRDLLKE
jgi:cytochrome c-type biogenesis protein CcmH